MSHTQKIFLSLSVTLSALVVAGAGCNYYPQNTTPAAQTPAASTQQQTLPAASTPVNQTPAVTAPPAASVPAIQPVTKNISIQNFSFSPATLEIKTGDTVVWKNLDSAPHVVVENNGKFTSPTLGQGEQFSFTFTAAGTFDYHCQIHPSMTGQIIVK